MHLLSSNIFSCLLIILPLALPTTLSQATTDLFSILVFFKFVDSFFPEVIHSIEGEPECLVDKRDDFLCHICLLGLLGGLQRKYNP